MAKRDLYEIQGDKLVRKRKHCPKCGEGVFLAEHKDRTSCGACGYTEFKKQKADAKPKQEGKPKADEPKKTEKPKDEKQEKSSSAEEAPPEAVTTGEKDEPPKEE